MSIDFLTKISLTLLLIPITSLHVYWLCGGEISLDGALPTDLEKFKKKFSPLSWVIGNSLLILPVIIALLYLILSFYISLGPLDKFQRPIYLFFSIVFIFRGLFGWLINKFTTKDIFKRRNIRIYSPISFCLGVLLFILYKFS
tara:strand:- start:112 stop:540 length:429 start_codon:yes stop_codon:yes gene_type:complete